MDSTQIALTTLPNDFVPKILMSNYGIHPALHIMTSCGITMPVQRACWTQQDPPRHETLNPLDERGKYMRLCLP